MNSDYLGGDINWRIEGVGSRPHDVCVWGVSSCDSNTEAEFKYRGQARMFNDGPGLQGVLCNTERHVTLALNNTGCVVQGINELGELTS